MTPPSTIGHYRIVSKLGEGGMGAVYRATDTKLNRDVAIKILPPAFAGDTARMQRFEREAQVLASLNHPNIAAIYGVEQGAIVMELVEGDDLQGPVSIDTAIDCARQIAAALEAAHEKGIIHRDLKPANIKVTPAGTVKLLDFGLAKATEALAAAASTSSTVSPTLSLTMTQAGMILGTAAYMAPEQARGKPVDRRADIWAFGAVLFELLTGKMLFAAGDNVTDIIAAVVTREPDWNLLPPKTPAHVRRLLERCLRKDPRLRLQAIGEARIALDEPDTAVPARRSWLPWAVAALFAIVAAVAADIAWLQPRPLDTSLVTTRFALTFPEDTRETVSTYSPQTVPSPDGRYLAFIAADGKGIPHLWVRPMGSVSARLLDNTEGANFPFWSPDGQFIAFFAEMKLKKIAVAGGPPYPLCEAPDNSVGILDAVRSSGEGGSWSRDGVIVFSPNALSPLMRVSAKGGPATPVTSLEQTGDEGHIWPQFLPDGRHILYLANAEETSRRGLYVQELGAPQRVLVLRTQYRGAWAGGYLLFVRQGTLLAQHLNTRTFQLEGEPLSVAEEVTYHPREGSAAFAASENGVLIYHSGGSITDARQLAWVDRSGKQIAPVGQPGSFLSVMLSPGEKSAALLVRSVGLDLSIVDLVSGVTRRMTDYGKLGTYLGPWSPDSQRIAVNEVNGGIQELTPASGKTTLLAADTYQAEDWAPDAGLLLATDYASRRQLVQLLPGETAKPQVLSVTPYRKYNFRFSPDGKYVAYQSEEFGTAEIFVAAFPSFAPKRQISSGGGAFPLWRRDGKELFFHGAPRNLMSVEIRTGSTIEATIPKTLFQYGTPNSSGNRFTVSGDGQRFLLPDSVGNASYKSETTVVLNWTADLKR